MTIDSDNFVRDVLDQGSHLLEFHLNREKGMEFLAQAISVIPGKGTKVVSLVGGAASGKSTLSKILVKQLTALGIRAEALGTDDFTKGDRDWRWANFEGNNPKDPIEKYDFTLLNEKIAAIKANDEHEVIAVPSYDAASGVAVDVGEEKFTRQIGAVDALIIEGDFHLVAQPDLVIFLHLPDELRLQNRMTRDESERGKSPLKTEVNFKTRHFTQHVPYTLPIVKEADIIVDATIEGEKWFFDIYLTKNYLANRNGSGTSSVPMRASDSPAHKR